MVASARRSRFTGCELVCVRCGSSLWGVGVEGKEGVSLEEGVDGFQQEVGDAEFGDETLGASLPGRQDHVFVAGGGNHEDRNVRPGSFDFRGGRETVFPRHPDIENHQIGVELHGFLNRFLAIGRLATYIKVRTRLENGADGLTSTFVVIRNQDSEQSWRSFSGICEAKRRLATEGIWVSRRIAVGAGV